MASLNVTNITGTPSASNTILASALVAIDSGVDALFQLDALLRAIKEQVGEYSDVARLAELGSYLAFDIGSHLSAERERITRRDAA